jgi:hypothetical protein
MDLLIQMQDLEDRIAPSIVRIATTVLTVQSLRELYATSNSRSKEIQNEATRVNSSLYLLEVQLDGFLEGSRILEKRVKHLLNSVGSHVLLPSLSNPVNIWLLKLTLALDVKTRATSELASDTMLDMTSNALEDSATVKIVTLVSLIFLPASFVAVSLLTFSLYRC